MKRVIVLLVGLFLFACSNETSIPKGVLEQEKMKAVMWDMMQADRFVAGYVLRDSVNKNVTDQTFKTYDRVFQLHHISKETFLKSFQFYILQGSSCSV